MTKSIAWTAVHRRAAAVVASLRRQLAHPCGLDDDAVVVATAAAELADVLLLFINRFGAKYSVRGSRLPRRPRGRPRIHPFPDGSPPPRYAEPSIHRRRRRNRVGGVGVGVGGGGGGYRQWVEYHALRVSVYPPVPVDVNAELERASAAAGHDDADVPSRADVTQDEDECGEHRGHACTQKPDTERG